MGKTDSPGCSEDDIALKSFFLGPQAENASWFNFAISDALNSWFQWRMSCYPKDGRAISPTDQSHLKFKKRQEQLLSLLRQVTKDFESEIPKFSPRYIGHMFSEISLPALLGHFVTLLHNPNNISKESSQVGRRFEEEGIELLVKMLGFESAFGHFTSGGTVANFEAFLRARNRLYIWLGLAIKCREGGISTGSLFRACHQGWESFSQVLHEHKFHYADAQSNSLLRFSPFEAAQKLGKLWGKGFYGPVLLVPVHRHYSWQKAAQHFGLGEEGLWPVKLTSDGTMDVSDLEFQIARAESENRPIVAVVSVVGTTEIGNVDPLSKIESLLSRLRSEENLHIWHHVDAAYGGFFCSLFQDKNGQTHLNNSVLEHDIGNDIASVRLANSVTLDPHKLGYVPYSCGAILVKHHQEYTCFDIDAPYISFEESRSVGTQTLEGSRSATGAVATWLTGKSIGFHSDGYGRVIARTISQKRDVEKLLRALGSGVNLIQPTHSNICCFFIANQNQRLSQVNLQTLQLYQDLQGNTQQDFFVSKTAFKVRDYTKMLANHFEKLRLELDDENLQVIRLCLMNPFFSSNETDVNFAEELVQKIATRVGLSTANASVNTRVTSEV